jgi:hypothetical protein
VPALEFVSALDCVSGLHRGVFSPETDRQAVFRSPTDTCNALLRHSEVRSHLKNRGAGLLWPAEADEETQFLAKELGQTVILPDTSMRQRLATPESSRELFVKSGVQCVPGVTVTIAHDTNIFDIALKARFGSSLVIQSIDLGGQTKTDIVVQPSDWQAIAGELEGNSIRLSRYILHSSYVVESIVMSGGTISGPILLLNKMNSGTGAVASSTETDGVRSALHAACKKIGTTLIGQGYAGTFTCKFYVESITGKVYLKNVAPGPTALSQLSHHITSTYGGLPLHLFHLAAFMDLDWDLDLAALQKRWSEHDTWTQLILTHSHGSTEFITKSPASSIYAMNGTQDADLIMPSIDAMDLRRSNEILFLRALGTGTYRQGNLETGLVISRGNLFQSKHAEIWANAMNQLFNTVHMSGSSLPESPTASGYQSLF